MIAHLSLREVSGRLAEQRCEVWAEIAIGKTFGKQLEQQQGTPESLHLGIGKVQSGGWWGCHSDRAIDSLKGFFGKDAVVADALHMEKSSVGLEADASERG